MSVADDCTKHSEVERRLGDQDGRLDKIDRQIEKTSAQTQANAVQIGMILKTYWIIAAAVIGAVVVALAATIGTR